MTDLASKSNPLAGTLAATRWRVQAAPTRNLMAGTLSFDSPSVPEFQFEIADDWAPWMQVMVADINMAARLPENWDSYGAERLNEKAALRAIGLLQALGFGGPAPWVNPSKDGGVHLEWARGSVGLELEVTESGEVSAVFEVDGEIEEWTTDCMWGDERLRVALQRVAAGE